ncbi:MAG: hypothetical protein M3150_05780 [Pseudomonadota bacterium]|nr:hypothetical protein [Pseudomonadota bacterium]
MKLFLVPFVAAFAGSAGHAQTPPPQRLSELRLAVLQSQFRSQPRATVAAPRRLTPAELAELRRQVQQQSRKAVGS